MDIYVFWLLAIVGVILTGISKSGFAGGAGVVAVPLLSLVIPVQQAVALMLPLLLIMDARTVGLYRKSVNLSDIKSISLAALCGIALAGTLMQTLSAVSLQIILAVFCILFAFWHNIIPLIGKLPGAAYVWGCVSGISSTLLHAGGPPINIYFIAKQIPKAQWLAQAAVFFAFMNVIKLVPYTLSGLWSQSSLLYDLLLLPVALLGVQAGYKIQKHLSEKQFMTVCRVLLACSGLGLLIKSFIN